MYSYSIFIQEVEKQMAELLGEGYNIEIHTVMKNNGVVRDGLCIFRDGKYLAPTIELNVYYEKYERTGSLNDILKEIKKVYVNKNGQPFTESDQNHIMDLEQIKGKIAYKLVNTNANSDLLKGIPHFDFLDLSIVFYLYIRNCKFGGMTVLIRNPHLDVWGISAEELYRLAEKNTPILFPAEIQAMNDLMKAYVDGWTELAVMLNENAKVPLYVLSNRMEENGAGTILYQNVLKKFADSNNADLAILPSSLHEVLLLPCNDETDFGELKEMVKSVNQLEAKVEDWLSDEVYYYCREDNRIFEADSLKLK